ncbi:MAG: Ldh family oxidoreductase [Thermoanaerobacteraceae bacterium]|nr:Ldh family oxidoreductase [Thermoanaerobacteraceae bacterium]
MKRYGASDLLDFCTGILTRLGVGEEAARLLCDTLVQANLRGVDSHGVTRMGIYVERIRRGLVDPRGEPEIIRDTPAVALMDARNTLGQVASYWAMRLAIEKAKAVGTGMVGVRGSNHFGAAAYYTMCALKEDLIGIALSNAPATMAPWGARAPYMGTNPLSVAVPAKGRLPIVFDMATSIVARGKIILAAQKGESIPEGWAMDAEGRITTDAEKALEGAVLPFGGAKGSAIAILIDVFAGILTGAAFGPHIGDLYRNLEGRQNLGHVFAAVDPGVFGDTDEFKNRIAQMIDEIKGLPPAYGVEEVLLPGEIEFRTAERRRREGIPLEPEVEEMLRGLGREFGVPWITPVGP